MVFLISKNVFPACNLYEKLTPANVLRSSRLKSFFQPSSLNHDTIAQNVRKASMTDISCEIESLHFYFEVTQLALFLELI